MRLLFYSTASGAPQAAIQQVVEGVAPRHKAETFRSIESLSRRLRQPAAETTIAVLYVATGEDLLNLLGIYELLCDCRMVLILPDRSPDTVAQALKMRPRFITFCDADKSEVNAVLQKMVKAYLRDSKSAERLHSY